MKKTIHHKLIVGREVRECLWGVTVGKCKLECGHTVGGLNLGKTHMWCYTCKPFKRSQRGCMMLFAVFLFAVVAATAVMLLNV